MKIQILGPGCAKCLKLYEEAEKAARKLQVDYTMEKVTDFQKIAAFGVMTTPALFVDGKLKCVGKVPSEEELAAFFKDKE